ncbi:MAG: 23S rRNA (uracil(1939)-C(5))-methyltransferase RlmD [Acutalibacteraceae bacterium]
MTEEKKCPLYKKCGGCQLQNLSYAQQLAFKQRKVDRLLGEFKKPEPIIGMDDPYHYRNKVQAAFATDRNGRIISGVYQSGTHSVVCVDSCLTEDRKADEIIVTIRGMLKSFKIPPYNERTRSGVLRHVLVKRGFSTGQIMVVIVTAGPILPAKNNFVKALLRAHPNITTIVHNINPYQTSLVLGERENVLYGTGRIEDELCGLTFGISPRSFYQINPVQTEVLYNTAMEYADMDGSERVIDAYCGVGTIGLVASKTAGEVIGVELNRDAVHDAIANAKRNGIKNERFYCADAGEFMLGMAQGGERADIVFMDPPRAGSDECFLSSLVTLAPKKVVYISCNPETQQRDLRFLTKRGYRVEKIQPVDMFPHTNHVETIVMLAKKETI